MPWLMFALAVGCLAVAFRTHSMALALITLLAALALMLAGTLVLASARIARNARNESEMMSAAEMRLVAESMRRKREQDIAATASGATAGLAAAGTARGDVETDASVDDDHSV